MHSRTAISGFFLGNLSYPDTSIKIDINTHCRLLFRKIFLADQDVKMAAIFSR